MPNWCHNKLTIKGAPALVAECVAQVAHSEQEGEPATGEAEAAQLTAQAAVNQPLDFEQIAPMPDELLQKGGIDAYEWALVNWGTKWNADFDGVFPAIAAGEEAELPRARQPIIEPDSAFYAFETAWSPPVPVIATLAKRYPGLEIELVWGEPGAAVAGRLRWREGELISDEELALDMALTPEEMWF
jgi:hypothetical protein